MSTTDRVYETIAEAIRKRKQQGIRIVCCDFGDQQKTCCALSALDVNMDASGWIKTAASFLEITTAQADDIVMGFDADDGDAAMDYSWWQVGIKLRNEFLPATT